jgi:DNA invertase Pin-like site-specific DNA recombinase
MTSRVSARGYTRVSAIAHTPDQQNAALAAAGVTKVFSDTMSAARDDRRGLAALLDYVPNGDAVAVLKLDRLGRDCDVTLISTTDGLGRPSAASAEQVAVLFDVLPHR